MPQAIPAIIATVKAAYTAAQAFVASGLTAVGVPAGAAAAAAAVIVDTTIQLAIGTAIGAISRPSIPDPEFARTNKKQAIPERVSGYGRVRLGGAYMLYEAQDKLAFNVFAAHDGMIDAWETLYLNDYVETVIGGLATGGFVQRGADRRYGPNDMVQIHTRVGHPTETRYAPITDTSIWPTNARGDGIASFMMVARSHKTSEFLIDYPNGLPQPSIVGRLQLCWNPRLGPRGVITDDDDKRASATWEWTLNPPLQLLDYMTNPETGMGFPISRFLPRIDTWIEAANVCDEAVDLKAGGTIPRYQASGVYLHSTPPADVIRTMLSTFDGWLAQDSSGVYIVQAGKYYPPTVTITDEHIISLDRQFYIEDERAVNEYTVSFTDPAFDYTEVETTPYRNQADIDIRGEVRTEKLSMPWVTNNSQAQRLAKIAMHKAVAPISGTLVTTLDGLRAYSERRIRIQSPSDSVVMADIVVDILPITINSDMSVTIPFRSCDPDGYEWDADTEEGDGAGDDTRPDLEPVSVPDIENIEAFDIDVGSARLRIFVDGEIGSSYSTQWRIVGTSVWSTAVSQELVADTPFPYFETGLVSASSLEVQIAAVTPSGALSDWSDIVTIDASVSVPSPPTSLTANDDVGAAIIAWSNPTSPVFAQSRVYRATTGGGFGIAIDVSGAISGAIGTLDSFTDVVAPGNYDYWVAAETAASVSSGPAGPASVTVT